MGTGLAKHLFSPHQAECLEAGDISRAEWTTELLPPKTAGPGDRRLWTRKAEEGSGVPEAQGGSLTLELYH